MISNLLNINYLQHYVCSFEKITTKYTKKQIFINQIDEFRDAKNAKKNEKLL